MSCIKGQLWVKALCKAPLLVQDIIFVSIVFAVWGGGELVAVEGGKSGRGR